MWRQSCGFTWGMGVGLWVIVGQMTLGVGAEPSLVGMRIYAKSNAVPIQLENKVIGTGVDLVYPLTVRKGQGEWLWIWVNGKKMEGWIHRSDVCTAGEAIKYFSERIATLPSDKSAISKRAMAWEELGNLDRALEDTKELVRLQPNANSYNSRGNIWQAKRFYQLAIKDFSEAIRLEPHHAWAYNNRGHAWLAQGEWAKAVADHYEAIRLEPEDAVAYNSLAWLRATCADGQFRDGRAAVELATKACQMTIWKEPVYIDTLAAAYAEVGQFDKAVEWQQRAMEMVAEKHKDDYRTRLELYRSKKALQVLPASQVMPVSGEARSR